MSKIASFLTALMLLVTITPASMAHNVIGDRSLEITKAEFETDRQRVIGNVTVCNTEPERMRFLLDVHNETINSLYKRRLSVGANKCQTYKLRFNRNFAEMSNAGDEVRILAKSVRGIASHGKYELSDPFYTLVAEGNTDAPECGDKFGEDEIYSTCQHDFIYHTPTGLRFKVESFDTQRVDLRVTHVRWGGVKDVRIYKGRSKEVVAGDDNNTKVEMTNILGDNYREFLFELETL